jgi:RNA polymerase sigma factor (TIGR02999 family)
MSEKISVLIDKMRGGEDVYDDIYAMVYDELKRMAAYKMRQEDPNMTYSRTELVHETYLKMVSQSEISFNDKSHFLAIASNCMRQVLIDHARKKNADKRGNNPEKRTYVDEMFSRDRKMVDELLEIDEALDRLAKLNPRLSNVVTMKFFGGMNIEEIAEALGISESTVNRDWIKARGWLHKELKG